MGAKEGNQNATGHSGKNAGRKSAYKEISDARMLWDIWNGKYTREELKKIIKNQKFGVKHIFAAKCMNGDLKAILPLLNKLFANKQSQEIRFEDKRIEEGLNILTQAIEDDKYTQNSADVQDTGETTDNNSDPRDNIDRDIEKEAPQDSSDTADPIR